MLSRFERNQIQLIKFIIFSNFILSMTRVRAIVAHSGVSNRFRKTDPNADFMKATIECVKAGFDLLKNGQSATDAVVAAISVMEGSGVTNSGRGSVKQNDGQQRMDASLMDSNNNIGAVASLRGFTHPIQLCKILMHDLNGHIMYAHDYAAQLAEAHHLEKLNDPVTAAAHPSPNDTVGAVAVDFNGNLSAGTSTGGRGNCEPGRIGDSCIIGAGTYCTKNVAVSNTGWGEWIVRLNCAKAIADLVDNQQFPPQAAVDRVGREFQAVTTTTLGSICLDKDGHWGIGITGASMGWAAIIQIEDNSPMLYYGCGKGEIFNQQYFPPR
jgi:beta-aspartyl-peptidase (threonine type)